MSAVSQFLSSRYTNVQPYRPGLQLHDRPYVKLNANETSMPPSPAVRAALTDALIDGLGRYADPHCLAFREAVAEVLGVSVEEVFVGNGSDEVLAIAFRTFFDDETPVAFSDITYNFYRDWCTTFGAPFTEVPLNEDFTVNVRALEAFEGHVVLVNPNAPTGIALPIEDIERIVRARPDRLVIVDEAYVDYSDETCVPLVRRYKNLIVVQTMSKSRNLAGAHIGFAVGRKELIDDMRDIKFSTNPFNVSSLTAAIGIAAVKDTDYLEQCMEAVAKQRAFLVDELRWRRFAVLPSKTNFVFTRPVGMGAAELCRELQRRGVLVRHYDQPRIADWLRITVGTPEENAALLDALDDCLFEAVGLR